MALLNETDILIDGRFEADKKSYECRFRGSTNQRYLDAKASVAAGKSSRSRIGIMVAETAVEPVSGGFSKNRHIKQRSNSVEFEK